MTNEWTITLDDAGTVASVERGHHPADGAVLLVAVETTTANEAAAILAQALSNNPIRRDLVTKAYALLRGIPGSDLPAEVSENG